MWKKPSMLKRAQFYLIRLSCFVFFHFIFLLVLLLISFISILPVHSFCFTDFFSPFAIKLTHYENDSESKNCYKAVNRLHFSLRMIDRMEKTKTIVADRKPDSIQSKN